jgi:hypothetical protein
MQFIVEIKCVLYLPHLTTVEFIHVYLYTVKKYPFIVPKDAGSGNVKCFSLKTTECCYSCKKLSANMACTHLLAGTKL